jgi:UDP-glucose 4-epimerase
LKTLITGGAGFIGSHLAEKLLAAGDDVFVIEHLKPNPKFHYLIDTIFNKPALAELVDRADRVFHLAAAVGVRLIVDNPVRTIETNIAGTQAVLELADKKKKKVIIASSSEVYGKSNKVPFAEEDEMVLGATTHSRWSYACSKAIDEFLALAYWRERGLPVVIVRLFNTVGPRQTGRYGMVVPRFVAQAIAGGQISVYGDGTQSRCFAHVADVLDGLMSLSANDRAVGQIFNIGTDEEITIGDLARKVQARVNRKAEIVFVPYEKAYAEGFEDMHRRVPDLSKIKKFTGYTPKHNMDSILACVHEYEVNRARQS